MTDTKYSPMSIDPASRGDLAGTVKLILTKFLAGVDDMLPAKVISYDRNTNRAKVQPMVYMVTTDGRKQSRAPVASIPVLQLGGGGFVLSFPIKPGDLGWIKANDRDISIFLQSLKESPPNTEFKHTFSDAMFIPDTMFKSVNIAGEDDDNVVLQSLDGSVKVSLSNNSVKIKASTKVTIDCPLTEITGELVTGTDAGQSATFGGNIFTPADVLAGTISLKDHVHDGVQPGGGNTGEPVP